MNTGLRVGVEAGKEDGEKEEHVISTFRFDVHYVQQDPGGRDSPPAGSWDSRGNSCLEIIGTKEV